MGSVLAWLYSRVSQERPAEAAFLEALKGAVRSELAVLFLVAALHKMNYDFFDLQSSCASQIIGSVIAQWVPSAAIARFVLPKAASSALVTEIGLGVGLYLPAAEKYAALAAQAFHVVLALPLPPGSFYPFSLICLLMYVPLRPAAFAEAVRDRGMAVFGVAAICAAYLTLLSRRMVKDEYPPYGVYGIGCGLCGALAALNSLALLARADRGTNGAGERRSISWFPTVRWPTGVSTLVVLLFLLHPQITQNMIDMMNCGPFDELDGEPLYRLQKPPWPFSRPQAISK